MATVNTNRLQISHVCVVAMFWGTALIAGTPLPSSAENGGPRRLAVTEDQTIMFRDPSRQAEQLGEFAKSTVLSNLGCSDVAGQGWCNVAVVGGGATGFVEAKRLGPAVGPDGVVAMGRDDSKRRAKRRDYDATDDIACAQNEGDSLDSCSASIARSGGGDATVVVTFSNSFSRELYFTHGAFRRGNSTMSGVGTDTEWTLQNGAYAIRVDDQRYVIPQIFILGY